MNNTFISPMTNRPAGGGSGLSSKIVIIIIMLAVAVIVAVGLMVLTSSNSPTEPLDRANARLATLKLMVDTGKENAESSDLRKIISDASILLIGDVSLMSSAASTAGASGKDKEIIASEDETELLERLATASVNGQFDMVYIPELIEKYEDTITLLASIERKSGNASVKSAATLIKQHCQTIIKQLQAITI